jgi:hypothetical protein
MKHLNSVSIKPAAAHRDSPAEEATEVPGFYTSHLNEKRPQLLERKLGPPSDLTYVKVGISLAVKERFAGEAKSFFHFVCIETRKGR